MFYSIGTSPNGWTDDHLCLEWFEKSFIPQATARNKSGKPILLIYDGHGSHTNVEIARLAAENNILLVQLPSHTIHKLQPLDVGVFGPFQRAWIERCEDIVIDLGEEMPIWDFVKEYMAVRTDSFVEKTIRMAWKKSGAWPIDKAVFSDGDYALSVPFSTTATHLPKDFDATASFPPVVAPDWACQCDHENDEDSNEEDDSDDEQPPHLQSSEPSPERSVTQLPAFFPSPAIVSLLSDNIPSRVASSSTVPAISDRPCRTVTRIFPESRCHVSTIRKHLKPSCFIINCTISDQPFAYVGFLPDERCAWCRGLGVHSEAGKTEWRDEGTHGHDVGGAESSKAADQPLRCGKN